MLSPAPLVEGLVVAVVTAAAGSPLAACAAEAERGLAAKAQHLSAGEEDENDGPGAAHAGAAPQSRRGARNDGEPGAPDDLSFSAVVDLPHGLHARPAAAITTALAPYAVAARARNASTRSPWADATSVTGLAGLGLGPGDELEMTLSGADAEAARASLAALVADHFGEAVAPAASAEPADESPMPIVGPAHRLVAPDLSRYVQGEEEEARLSAAVDRVAAFWTAHARGPFEAIVRAQQALLLDRHFLAPAYNAVSAGASAPAGVALAVGQNALRFERLPAYLRARAEDVRGLGRLLVAALLDAPLEAQLPRTPYVLVAAELDVATALGLDPEVCQGVVTWMGSPQGHGALMCGELGIPIRCRMPAARDLAEGELVELGDPPL